MATPADPTQTSMPTGERIEDIDVSAEMQGSFLEYAYSVIYSRALPDARDGLNPCNAEFCTKCRRWAFARTADT
jgi:DNA gyrase subunit A